MNTFNTHDMVTVFHYNDVTCQEWNTLRNKLAKYEIKMKVIPVKLSSKVHGCDRCIYPSFTYMIQTFHLVLSGGGV